MKPETGCKTDHVGSKAEPLLRHAQPCTPAPCEQHGIFVPARKGK